MRWRRRLTWNPGALAWRVAALFIVGAFVFALGSFPPYSQALDPRIVGVTFAVGAVFFTCASYSQFVQTINADDSGAAVAGPPRRLAWQPGRILWWATVVQLAGTLFFNVSTIDALAESLTTQEANRLVWAPDFFGSIAFLIASHLAWLFVCGRVWRVLREDADWWIAALNYAGSIAFMISAICSFTLTTTGSMVNTTLVNLGTFIGALCFFAGAYLLLPAAPRPT